LTALAKLATRFETNAERIHALIRNYTAHINLELQQRSVEYARMLLKDDLKYGLLERMPAIEYNILNESIKQPSEQQLLIDQPVKGNIPDLLNDSTVEPVINLLDSDLSDINNSLFDIIGHGNGAPAKSVEPRQNSLQNGCLIDFQDLLSTTKIEKTVTPEVESNLSNFLDLGGINENKKSDCGQIAVNKNGIEVQLYVDSAFSNNEASLRFITTNNNPVPIDNFNFQAAVTKAYQIELFPPTSSHLDANAFSTITQLARIKRSTSGSQLRLRLRINYLLDGRSHTLQDDVSNILGLS